MYTNDNVMCVTMTAIFDILLANKYITQYIIIYWITRAL